MPINAHFDIFFCYYSFLGDNFYHYLASLEHKKDSNCEENWCQMVLKVGAQKTVYSILAKKYRIRHLRAQNLKFILKRKYATDEW